MARCICSRRAEPKLSPDQSKLAGIAVSTQRVGFLRKVYGLLGAQLACTVCVALLLTFVPFLQDACLSVLSEERHAWWFTTALFVPTVLSLLALQCGGKHSYPANYMLLAAFTVFISLDVGFVCSVLQSSGFGAQLLQAAGITVGLFLGLTALVYRSGNDFSYLGSALRLSLLGLTATSLLAMWFPSLAESLVLSGCGALVFVGYILFDTWRLENKLGCDDYILATIELYLDVVNLFLKVLQILVKLQKKKKK